MLDSLGVKRYRTIRLVGRGGMGELYEVWDSRLERRVAVKRLHPHLLQRKDSEQLVLGEARAAARVEHVNVVRVYGVEQAGDALLIEMQFIDGQPLSALLNHQPLPAEPALDLLTQIAGGLAACHAKSVIHCDLKPANVLVTPDGTVYLTDFGIARALQGALGDEADDTLVPNWGTPRYRPPEAWHGEAPTPYWDIYAAGVLLYEALSGLQAFDGGTVLDVREQVYRGIGASIGVHRPDLSPQLIALVDSMVSVDPGLRPQSAREILRLLRATPEHAQYGERTQDSGRRQGVGNAPTSSDTRSETSTRSEQESVGESGAGWEIWARRAALLAFLLLIAGALVYVTSGRTSEVPETAEGAGTVPAVAPNAPTAPPNPPVPGKQPEKVETLAEPIVTKTPSEPQEFCVAGDVLYFSWDDGVHGREPWALFRGMKPMMMADLNKGPDSSNPREFQRLMGRTVVFVAETPETGTELWRCLGPDGDRFLPVELVKDINDGTAGSDPDFVARWNDILLYYASTRLQGRELWWTKGSTSETAQVTDWRAGYPGSGLHRTACVQSGKDVYLQSFCDPNGQLCLIHYDFETNAITNLSDCGYNANSFAILKGKLFFRNDGPEVGAEMWVYDPAEGAPHEFINFPPWDKESSPHEFYAWEDRLMFFQATVEGLGAEPWVTDGTVEGTRLLKDINPQDGASSPYAFISAGREVFFRATDPVHGKELWVTDGTEARTRIVADIYPGDTDGDPYNTAAYGGKLFFSARDPKAGEELFVAEWSAGDWAIRRLTDLNPVFHSFPNTLQFTEDGVGFFRGFGVGGVPWIYRLLVHGDQISVEKVEAPGADAVPPAESE